MLNAKPGLIKAAQISLSSHSLFLQNTNINLNNESNLIKKKMIKIKIDKKDNFFKQRNKKKHNKLSPLPQKIQNQGIQTLPLNSFNFFFIKDIASLDPALLQFASITTMQLTQARDTIHLLFLPNYEFAFMLWSEAVHESIVFMKKLVV